MDWPCGNRAVSRSVLVESLSTELLRCSSLPTSICLKLAAEVSSLVVSARSSQARYIRPSDCCTRRQFRSFSEMKIMSLSKQGRTRGIQLTAFKPLGCETISTCPTWGIKHGSSPWTVCAKRSIRDRDSGNRGTCVCSSALRSPSLAHTHVTHLALVISTIQRVGLKISLHCLT